MAKQILVILAQSFCRVSEPVSGVKVGMLGFGLSTSALLRIGSPWAIWINSMVMCLIDTWCRLSRKGLRGRTKT